MRKLIFTLLLSGTVLMTTLLVLGAGGSIASPSVQAKSMQVTIKNFSFQPATLTVSVGTTVTWTNQDSVAHTSTSDTGVWDSGSLGTGQSFSFTFKHVGRFPYHCAIHPYMKGTIVVQGSATTPTPSPPSAPELHMGPIVMVRRPAWLGFYDGYKDTYLNTDVSDKAQASAMHVNYAPALARLSMNALPAMYLVQGRAAKGQLAVFGSEPGDKDYTPLWNEVIVRWKPHVRPVLLVRDDQVLALAKKGKLVLHHTHIVLNCPIIKVGK
jgi:plastocyanin